MPKKKKRVHKYEIMREKEKQKNVDEEKTQKNEVSGAKMKIVSSLG